MSRGAVFKRGSTWSVKFDLAPDPTTGKRRQKMVGGFPTKERASKALTKLLRDVDQGTFVEPTRATVSEFLEEWLTTIAPTIRPSTLYSYRRNLELHVVPYIGAGKLTAIDAGVLNGLYARLLASGRRDREGGLSARSVRYVHAIVHRALKDATRWDRIARNPADSADPPRLASSETTVSAWSSATLRQFLDASKAYGDRYYAAWVTLATTGARRGEVLGLRWEDVDLDAGRARIVQTVVAIKHEVSFGAPKTARGRRPIALDAGTVTVLREWRARQNAERLALGPGYKDHGLIFSKVTGEPLHPERFSREFDRRVERWKLPKLSLHGLRHTWATLALESGVHPRVVQERLGHATTAITLQVYSHVAPTMHDAAAELIAARLLS